MIHIVEKNIFSIGAERKRRDIIWSTCERISSEDIFMFRTLNWCKEFSSNETEQDQYRTEPDPWELQQWNELRPTSSQPKCSCLCEFTSGNKTLSLLHELSRETAAETSTDQIKSAGTHERSRRFCSEFRVHGVWTLLWSSGGWNQNILKPHQSHFLPAVRGTCGTRASSDFWFWARSWWRTGSLGTGSSSFRSRKTGTSERSACSRGGSRRTTSSAGTPRCWRRTEPAPTGTRTPAWRRRRNRSCEERRRGRPTPPAWRTRLAPTPSRPPPPLPSRWGCRGPGDTPPPGPRCRGNGAGWRWDEEPRRDGGAAPAA